MNSQYRSRAKAIKPPNVGIARSDIRQYEILVSVIEISDHFIQKHSGIGLQKPGFGDDYFIFFQITNMPTGFNVKKAQRDFQDSYHKEIIALITQKFQGALKFQASEAQQIVLVELGIITGEDLDNAAPMARAAFLEGDLGL